MNRILKNRTPMQEPLYESNSTKLNLAATFAVFFTLLFGSQATFAKDSKDVVRYFVPGKYALTEGEQHLCGEGDFYLTADQTRIWLGPYYSFMTTNGSDTGKGGLPNDKDCVYQTEGNIAVKGKKTTMNNVSTMLCGQTKRQVITNTAVITKQGITLDQSSQVDPHFADSAGGTPHHCAWKKTK